MSTGDHKSKNADSEGADQGGGRRCKHACKETETMLGDELVPASDARPFPVQVNGARISASCAQHGHHMIFSSG